MDAGKPSLFYFHRYNVQQQFLTGVNLALPKGFLAISEMDFSAITAGASYWNLLGMLIHIFHSGSVEKNPPTNAGDTGSIPGSGRSLEKEVATHSDILACEISWTEEPDGLQPVRSPKVRHG